MTRIYINKIGVVSFDTINPVKVIEGAKSLLFSALGNAYSIGIQQ